MAMKVSSKNLNRRLYEFTIYAHRWASCCTVKLGIWICQMWVSCFMRFYFYSALHRRIVWLIDNFQVKTKNRSTSFESPRYSPYSFTRFCLEGISNFTCHRVVTHRRMLLAVKSRQLVCDFMFVKFCMTGENDRKLSIVGIFSILIADGCLPLKSGYPL